ncbi:UPF0164 family protein [Spirochaetia bacterium 38H-sp]|uniref:UPF0164 family protein n=1 Tax=Rarispira pelagica TaxID=3141764 RepID=A0ABU9UB42_9SPIR
MSNRRYILIIFFIGIISTFLSSQDFSSTYGSLAEYLSALEDENTGLTIFPILTIPLGGEYQAMGTAYTAVTRHTAFMDSNPAATAASPFTELTLYHNNWIADSNLEGITYTVRYDDFGLGYGGKFLYVPFTQYDSWGQRVATGYYSEIMSVFNASYNFFSSYDFFGLAAGISSKVAFRSIPRIFYENQSAMAIMADIGILSKFNLFKFYSSRSKNFSVGITVKNLGLEFLAPTGEPLPTSFTSGIAYSPIRPLLITFDFSLPFNLIQDVAAESSSYATGIVVDITNFLTMQTGILIKGGNPRISIGSLVTLGQIEVQTNYTLDMTTTLTPLDKMSITLTFNLGDEGRGEKQKQVDKYYLQALDSYAKGDLEKTIELCEKALAIDPDFSPAQKTLKIAKESVELQNKMLELQQIER